MLTREEHQKLNILEILDSYSLNYKVTPAGNANFCCPFHHEKNPSCGMHKYTGLWKCFACGISGNLVSFVAEMDNSDLDTAEKKIRKQWINRIPDTNTLYATVVNILSRRPSIVENDPTFPEWILSKYTRNWDYMHTRGFKDETLQFFNVVYDPQTQYQGFPCYDLDNKLVGVTGRNTQNGEPRYFPLIRFRKSQFVFNMNRIDKTKPVIAVEGEINCMAMYQHGYQNTVAFLGASVSQHQIDIIKNSGVKELIIFFDSDPAGNKGTKTLFKNLWPYMKIRTIKEHEGDPAELNADQVKSLVDSMEKFVVKLEAFS